MNPRYVRWLAAAAVIGATLGAPDTASAQYKNLSFGFDLGYWWNLQNQVFNPSTGFVPVGNRPLRLSMGGRLGGETSLKLDEDHWWLMFRLNLGLDTFTPTTIGNTQEVLYDREANRTLGTIFMVQGSIGIRYYFMTDRLRPYLQLAASYAHFFSFQNLATEACNAALCGDASVSNLQGFLVHENAGGIHLQPGLEWIVARDIGITFFIDAQTWFMINVIPGFSITGAVGMIFYN